MSQRYLEVTYREGKPLAAYFYLPRRSDDQSVRVEPHGPGYLVDWTEDGRPIGIEMPSPTLVTLDGLNHVLAELHLEPAHLMVVGVAAPARRCADPEGPGEPEPEPQVLPPGTPPLPPPTDGWPTQW